ncbi:MAG: hypothetical protein M3P32_09500 [Chloroflexota bacterium]|nr:hypothetical protein [Chloroflexota bacterium]
MQAFIVELPNRPGSLAAACEALGARGVNILACAGATSGSVGSLAFTADDPAGALEVLDEHGWSHREVELVTAALEHRPGALGAAARVMADAGVNVETMFATGMDGRKVLMAFGVSDPGAALAALGDLARD